MTPVIALLLSSLAPTQPIHRTLESIEWMVADSQLVVTGRITNIEPIESDDWHTLYHATISVDSTIKGPRRKQVQIVVDSRKDPGHTAQWKKEGARLLIFLQESKYLAGGGVSYYAREGYAPRGGYDEDAICELRDGAKVQAFTSGLRPLSKPEDLIDTARQAAKEEPKGVCPAATIVDVPEEAYRNQELVTRPFNGGLSLKVPIDDRLEDLAHQWVRSTDKDVRVTGAKSLCWFRTDDNVEVLRSLLKDEAYSDIHYVTEDVVKRVYVVRVAAASVLNAWGYEIGG